MVEKRSIVQTSNSFRSEARESLQAPLATRRSCLTSRRWKRGFTARPVNPELQFTPGTPREFCGKIKSRSWLASVANARAKRLQRNKVLRLSFISQKYRPFSKIRADSWQTFLFNLFAKRFPVSAKFRQLNKTPRQSFPAGVVYTRSILNDTFVSR